MYGNVNVYLEEMTTSSFKLRNLQGAGKAYQAKGVPVYLKVWKDFQKHSILSYFKINYYTTSKIDITLWRG